MIIDKVKEQRRILVHVLGFDRRIRKPNIEEIHVLCS